MKKIIILTIVLASCATYKKTNYKNQFKCPVVMLGDTATEPDSVKDTTFNWYAGRHY